MSKKKIPQQVSEALAVLYRAAWGRKPAGMDWPYYAGQLSGQMISAVNTITTYLDLPMPGKAEEPKGEVR
jgi:hypothetical protein